MIQSPQLQSRIATWRQKATEGTMTLEEAKEAVAALREGRMSVPAEAAAKRKKAVAAIPTADSLLSELDGL